MELDRRNDPIEVDKLAQIVIKLMEQKDIVQFKM